MSTLPRPWSVALALFSVACSGPQPPSARGCSPLVGRIDAPVGAPGRVLAVGTDYVTGTAWEIPLDGSAPRELGLALTGDSVLRPLGGGVLAVLNRSLGGGDNLTLFSRERGRYELGCQVSLVTDGERSLGRQPWANAHDVIAVDRRRLYVARYLLPSLAVVDLETARIVATIDLSAGLGRARLPHPDALARVGDEVWVTLERLDDFPRATQPGAIVRIDPRSDRVVGAFSLRFANPVGPLRQAPDGRWWVATIGDYDVVGDGAIEAITVAPDGTPTVGEPVLTEVTAGGNIDGFAIVDRGTAAPWVIAKVSGRRTSGGDIEQTRWVSIDLATGSQRVLLERRLWAPATPVAVGGSVWIGDPGEAPTRAGAGVFRTTAEGASRSPTTGLGRATFPYDLQLAP